MLPLLLVPFLLCATGISGSFLLNLRLSLIGGRLLFFQSLLRSLVRFRSRNISRRRAGIGSLRKAASSLLLGEFSHAIFELFAEVVVHFLQIIHRDRAFATHFAIRLFAGSDLHCDVLIVIWRLAGSGNYVSVRQRALVAVHHQGEVGRHHKGGEFRIQRGRRFVLAGRGSPRGTLSLFCLGLLRRKQCFHFVGKSFLHVGAELWRFRRGGHRKQARHQRTVPGIGMQQPTLIRFGFGRVCSLQTGRQHVTRQPEGRRRIHRVRLVIRAIVAIPGRSSPTPTVGHRRRPRVIGPPVVSRMVIVGGIVA